MTTISCRAVSLHALKAGTVGLVDLRDRVVVLGELGDELGGVEHAVAASGLDHLGLLLQRKVLPLEAGADNVPEQGENLVVGDGARVGEVINTRVLVLRH